jgi:hypothetical protein
MFNENFTKLFTNFFCTYKKNTTRDKTRILQNNKNDLEKQKRSFAFAEREINFGFVSFPVGAKINWGDGGFFPPHAGYVGSTTRLARLMLAKRETLFVPAGFRAGFISPLLAPAGDFPLLQPLQRLRLYLSIWLEGRAEGQDRLVGRARERLSVSRIHGRRRWPLWRRRRQSSSTMAGMATRPRYSSSRASPRLFCRRLNCRSHFAHARERDEANTGTSMGPARDDVYCRVASSHHCDDDDDALWR